MEHLIDFAIFFLTLGFIEAVVKPIAKKFVQRKVLNVAPALLKAMDLILPELLNCEDDAELEARVRKMAEELTGEDWGNINLTPIFEMFDLRKTVTNRKTM